MRQHLSFREHFRRGNAACILIAAPHNLPETSIETTSRWPRNRHEVFRAPDRAGGFSLSAWAMGPSIGM